MECNTQYKIEWFSFLRFDTFSFVSVLVFLGIPKTRAAKNKTVFLYLLRSRTLLKTPKTKNQCSLVGCWKLFFSSSSRRRCCCRRRRMFVCTLLQSFSRCFRSIRDFLFILCIVFDAFFRFFSRFYFVILCIVAAWLVGYFLMYFFSRSLLCFSFPGWSCCCCCCWCESKQRTGKNKAAHTRKLKRTKFFILFCS